MNKDFQRSDFKDQLLEKVEIEGNFKSYQYQPELLDRMKYESALIAEDNINSDKDEEIKQLKRQVKQLTQKIFDFELHNNI